MTVEGKLGIKETKEVLKVGLMLQEALKGALSDGKFGFEDIAQFIPLLGSVSGAIEGIEQVPAELADLDAGEFDELVLVVQDVIKDVTPDKWEEVVFKGLDLGKAVLVAIKS